MAEIDPNSHFASSGADLPPEPFPFNLLNHTVLGIKPTAFLAILVFLFLVWAIYKIAWR
jgi:hypothetical protein